MGGSVRDSIKAYSPKWLQAAIGEKFLYIFGFACDVLAEKANQAMRMHIPTYGDPSGLATIGTDRLIPQGLNETPAAYARRLKVAYDDWQIAGSSRSVLRQMLGYLTPSAPAIRIVGNGSGSVAPWDFYLAGASTLSPPVHYYIAPNWNWDGSAWYRVWLIIDCSSGAPFVAESTWGTGTWGDGGTWGSSATVAQVNEMRSLVALWKPAGVTFVNIILSFTAANFDPSAAAGSGVLPDGNWAYWHKYNAANTAIPSRFPDAAYLDGAT